MAFKIRRSTFKKLKVLKYEKTELIVKQIFRSSVTFLWQLLVHIVSLAVLCSYCTCFNDIIGANKWRWWDLPARGSDGADFNKKIIYIFLIFNVSHLCHTMPAMYFQCFIGLLKWHKLKQPVRNRLYILSNKLRISATRSRTFNRVQKIAKIIDHISRNNHQKSCDTTRLIFSQTQSLFVYIILQKIRQK